MYMVVDGIPLGMQWLDLCHCGMYIAEEGTSLLPLGMCGMYL